MNPKNKCRKLQLDFKQRPVTNKTHLARRRRPKIHQIRTRSKKDGGTLTNTYPKHKNAASCQNGTWDEPEHRPTKVEQQPGRRRQHTCDGTTTQRNMKQGSRQGQAHPNKSGRDFGQTAACIIVHAKYA